MSKNENGLQRAATVAQRAEVTVDRAIFMKVDLEKWVYGTIDKHRKGQPWNDAWLSTYREIGGQSNHSGQKGCPRAAAETLYEFGRLKNTDRPFKRYDISELWHRRRNGTYAIIAIRLLRYNPNLSLTDLWSKIKRTVRAKTGDEPARSNQGGPTLAYQLWHAELIEDPPPGGGT